MTSYGAPAPDKPSSTLCGTHVGKLRIRESGVCPRRLSGRAGFSLAYYREELLQDPPTGPFQGPATLVVHIIAMVEQLPQALGPCWA